MSQIVTTTFFKYKKFTQKWVALANMGIMPGKLAKIEGAEFTKLMGSGGGQGFGAKPNFSTYAFMVVWKDRASAEKYFNSEIYQRQKKQSVEQWTIFFKCYSAHGSWDKKNPFQLNSEASEDTPIIVITRASLRYKHILKFWKRVPSISDFIQTKNANIFSVGIGERPWVLQVTFSIWDSEKQMVQFAHKDKHHAEAARASLKYGWFKESMFSRFHVIETRGTWGGKMPLSKFNADASIAD